MGPFSRHGPSGSMEDVGSTLFLLEVVPSITLGGDQPLGEVTYAQGPVLRDGNCPGINFGPFSHRVHTYWPFFQ